jgi:tetratricopeptide (TPR) repeat protein
MGKMGVLYELSHTLNNVGWFYSMRGELERGRLYIEQALEVARRLGDPLSIAFMTGNVGQNALLKGEWDEARSYLEQALDLVLPLGSGWALAYIYLDLGELSLAEGKVEEGTRSLLECIAIAESSGDLQGLRWAHRVLAEQDLLEGRPDAALERLQPLLDRPGLEEALVTDLLPVLAEAQLALGQVEVAEETAANAVTRGIRQKNRLSHVRALRARSKVLAKRGRRDGAEADLEEAVTLARQIAYPYAEAQALHDMGVLRLRQEGGGLDRNRPPSQAREPLEAALAIFVRLGAKGDIERTKQTLAQLQQSD